MIPLFLVRSQVQGQTNPVDSLALVQLYDSTQGSNWTNQTNWKTSQSISTWFGVSGTWACGGSGCSFDIRKINLTHNNLIGIIPSSIGNFPELADLRLDSNLLSGTIPSSLGNLHGLSHLGLSHNQFSGSIPSGIFKSFAFLAVLDLSSNQLIGSFPSSLGIESSLEYLDLSENYLSGTIPSTLYNHDSLARGSFSIYGNQLTFAGMEILAQQYTNAQYAPQASIHITKRNGTLYVSPGGTLINDTLRWYRNNVLDTAIVGDTSFAPRSPGKYSVMVTNALATRLTLFSDTIDILATSDSLRPQLSNFFPKTGSLDTVVRIAGKRFTGTTSVSFGGTRAASFIINSDTIITATVGAGASGSVSVSTPEGSDSLAGFTYTSPVSPAPLIYSFSPTFGILGSNITITGKYFTGTIEVSFGGKGATSYSMITDTSIIAIVGAGATGNVIVRTANGADTLGGFTYGSAAPSPAINSFNPATAGTGTTVTINGKNFSGVTAVSFGGISANSFQLVSDTVITAIVGGGASGIISITTVNGTAELGGFVFSSQQVPLPFTLIHFTGMLAGTQAQLQWQTSNEQAISSYIVESSGDSVLFTAIGAVNPTGDSGINTYSFIDSLPPDSINYYRLKMVDTAGNFSVSNIIAVQLPVNPHSIKIYPNPAIGYVVVQHPALSTPAQIKLLDMMGRVIKTIQVIPNTVQTQLDLTGVPPGMYKIVWTGGGNSLTQTLLID